MNDEDIDKQIVDQLYWDNSVSVADVAVTVEDGWVTLEGTVPSYHAKVTATDDAYQVLGVKFVDNKLRVAYKDTHSDNGIEADIVSALDWDFDLDAQDIAVSVNEGEVKLLGTVDAYWKKFIAEQDVAKVRGVRSIRNEIAIVPTGEWSDEQIAKAVEEAMRRNVNVDVNDVDITVDDGEVTLTGVVSDWQERYAADSSALYTTGVRAVDNELQIG